jgi:hypothetical protein
MPGARHIWFALLALFVTAPAWAEGSGAPGIPVDSRGGPTIDPTKNVLDLVAAAIKRQDDLRDMEAKFQSAMRDAETRRLNELAIQKQAFDLELAKVLRGNLDGQALLLATQLKELKTDLQSELRLLNQFRWESGGRNSGQGEVVAWIVSGVLLLVAVGSLVTTVVVAVRRPNKTSQA